MYVLLVYAGQTLSILGILIHSCTSYCADAHNYTLGFTEVNTYILGFADEEKPILGFVCTYFGHMRLWWQGW